VPAASLRIESLEARLSGPIVSEMRRALLGVDSYWSIANRTLAQTARTDTLSARRSHLPWRWGIPISNRGRGHETDSAGHKEHGAGRICRYGASCLSCRGQAGLRDLPERTVSLLLRRMLSGHLRHQLV
jgi:hypothetical protein